MTYPQVTTNDDADEPADRRRRPVQPALPRDRGAGPEVLGRGRHLHRVGRGPRRRHRRRQRVRLLRRAALRQRPAALRPPAHRLRQGHRPALPDDARQARRAPLRLGHPRPARRARGAAPARPQDEAGHRRARHRHVQRRLPQLGAQVHRRVARLRHPPGALGRLRPRLQDARARLHGVGHLGLQAAAREGPRLRGLPRAALLLERPDAAVQPRAAHGRRRLQDAPGPGRHRRAAPRDRRARPRLDDDAVDPAGQPRHHGPPRHRLRRRRVRRHRHDGALRHRRGPPRGLRQGPLRARRRPGQLDERIVERLKGADLLGRSFTPPFTYYAGARARAPRLPGRLRHHRGRHRARPHRRRLR